MRAKTSLDSRSRRGLAWFVGCGIALSTFGSCRIIDEPMGPLEPESPQVYLAGLAGLGVRSTPESATWSMGVDTAEVSLVRDRNGAVVAAKAVLDSAPRDTVRVGLWRAGVRFGQAIFRYDGSPALERVGYLEDGLAEGILARMDASTNPGSFESTLAEALVKGDSLLDDHPYRVPEGADSGAVAKFVVLELVETGKPFAEAVAAGAAHMDTNGLKDLIRELAGSGEIRDTSKIFPPPPPPPQDRTPPSVRIVSPAHDSILPFGSEAMKVVVRVDDSSGVDSVWIAGFPAVLRGGEWVLEHLAWPQNGSVLRIVARARDLAGNVATDSVQVRLQGDQTGPVVSVVSPSSDAKFAHDSDSVSVKVLAQDASGVDSVRIGGVEAVLVDGTWLARVPVPVGTSTIAVRAVDGAGMASVVSVSVERAEPPAPKDSVGPVIVVVSPSIGAKLAHDSDSVSAKVLAQDASGVDSVRIGGVEAVLVDGSWIARVPVPVGTSTIAVRAVDGAGNVSTAGVSVDRAAPPPRDTLGPSIRVLAPTLRELPYDSVAATISVVVADPGGVASLRIGDSSMPLSDSVCSRRVALAAGENVFALVAEDRFGNRSFDTLVVERSAVPPPDTLPPVLKRGRGAVSRSVPFDSSFALVAWSVWDDRKLSEVRIGDTLVAGDEGVYFRALPLRVGGNVVVAKATDSAGNSATDTVRIAREQDTTRPVVVRATEAEVWLEPGVPGATLSWKIHDNLPMKVAIGGNPVSGLDSIYSQWVVVAGPSVTVTIKATDEAGNWTQDVVVIRRLGDTLKPELRRNAGTNDTTVSGETEEWTFGWVVRDNSSLGNVRICGMPIEMGASDSSFSGKAGLVDGSNVFWIEAEDAFGNVATDTIRVTRVPVASGAPRSSSGTVPAARKAPSIVVFVTGKEPE